MTAFNGQPSQPMPPAPDGSPQSSRRWMLVATAAAAAGLGVGAAWWRSQGADHPTEPPLLDDFWSQQWPSPDGQVVAMQSFRGRPLVINFWATWCAPCIEELPLINAFYRANKNSGWQVLGLAVDQLAPVQRFLKQMPLDFPVAMAGLSGTELGRGLGNLAGGLPFSVVVGREGNVVQRKLGRLKDTDLEAWLRLK